MLWFRSGLPELAGEPLAGTVQADLGGISRATDHGSDRGDRQALPGRKPQYLPVGFAQRAERCGEFHVGGDHIRVITGDITAGQQTCPFIQPAPPGQGSALVGYREVGGPVQPRQWPGRQLVKVAPGRKECLCNDILSKVCTNAPAGVGKDSAVVCPEQVGELPCAALCVVSGSSITMYASGDKPGDTPTPKNFEPPFLSAGAVLVIRAWWSEAKLVSWLPASERHSSVAAPLIWLVLVWPFLLVGAMIRVSGRRVKGLV